MSTSAKDIFGLHGKVAVVTGSSSGIGRAIACALGQHGALVAVLHLADDVLAESCLAEIRQAGSDGLTLSVDLSREDSAAVAVQHIVGVLGPIDILVLNAAVERRMPWLSIAVDDIEKTFRPNLWSNLNFLQQCLPGMAERGWGRVLTIGSIQQTRPRPDSLVYAASKQALLSIVRNLARHYAKDGVTINTIAPGSILTARSRDALADHDFRRTVESKIPAGRIGMPEDCIGAALLLCSDAGGYINGANLSVDGGWNIGDE